MSQKFKVGDIIEPGPNNLDGTIYGATTRRNDNMIEGVVLFIYDDDYNDNGTRRSSRFKIKVTKGIYKNMEFFVDPHYFELVRNPESQISPSTYPIWN